jgi:hypothetical protein
MEVDHREHLRAPATTPQKPDQASRLPNGAGAANGRTHVKHPSRTILATLATSALLLTGCGSSNGSSGSDTGADSGSETKTTPAPAKPAAPAYRVLGKPALTKALIGIGDLPPGYSQDPPSPGTNKTFCDYKPPFNEKTKVSRDFTKGGGLSGELLSVGIRQYANTEQAKAAYDALAKALETCHGETDGGTKYTYAAMSAAKVGDASLGVKISTDDAIGLQNFALVGPVLINTGGGGLMNANADQITDVLKAQVRAYKTAALR